MGIWEIIGVIVGLLTVTLSYTTWFERKRDKKIKKRLLAERQEKKEIKEELLLEVAKAFSGDWEALDTQVMENIEKKLEDFVKIDDFCDLSRIIKSIDNKLNEHFIESLEGERDRLAWEILNYHQDLRNRIWKTRMSFDHISKSYDRYKTLKGNSFIDETFKEIKSMMRIQNESK